MLLEDFLIALTEVHMKVLTVLHNTRFTDSAMTVLEGLAMMLLPIVYVVALLS